MIMRGGERVGDPIADGPSQVEAKNYSADGEAEARPPNGPSAAGTTRPPLLPLAIIVMVILLALFGPLMPFIDAFSGNLRDALLPPVWSAGGTWDHPLGTDQVGRDVLSRIVVGARVTVIVALSAVALSAIIGTTIGLVSGYLRGWVDAFLMRATDATLSIPMLVLGLALATALGPGTGNVVIVVTAITWAFFARLVRGEVLHLRTMDYVAGAVVIGVPRWRIVFMHLLPNVMAPIMVMATLQVGNTIIIAASLSFLGLGVPDPQPEWGLMVADAKNYLNIAPSLAIFPGIALGATVLSSNLLGDWLSDYVDPTTGLRSHAGGSGRQAASGGQHSRETVSISHQEN